MRTQDLGIKVGDTLRLSIKGKILTGKVTEVREDYFWILDKFSSKTMVKCDDISTLEHLRDEKKEAGQT